MLSEIRRKGRIIYDSFFCKKLEDKIQFGKESSWNICVYGFSENTIVYSGGVGRDISFELELSAQFRPQIFMYDPSSTATETIETLKALPNNISFFNIGLSKFDKVMKFAYPEDELEGSFRKIGDIDLVTDFVEYQCKSISSLMKINGHQRIDLLKIDIEGFEYEVLEEIIENKIVVDQICVEFHHFLPGIKRKSTIKIIKQLKKMGYIIIHKRMTDYTFMLNK